MYKGTVVVGIHMSPQLRSKYDGSVYKCEDKGHWNEKQNSHAQQPWIVNQFNHYVLLVGYDANTNFIYKNSMGTDWGDKGYGTFQSYYDCGIRIVSYEFYASRLLSLGFIILVLWLWLL